MTETVIKELKNLINLLPQYLPENLNNPLDLKRLCGLAYWSHIENCRVTSEDILELLIEKFPNWDRDELKNTAENYLDRYDTFLVLLDFLDNSKLLKK